MQRAQGTLSLLTSALFVALALPAHADRIYLADGTIIEDADVATETAEKVTYGKDGKKPTEEVASDLVLRIEFTDEPGLFGAAAVDTENESFDSASASYEDYLSNLGSRGDRDHPWAAAAARYRLATLAKYANDMDALKARVASLKEASPESRYVPMALALSADAHIANNDKAGAIAAIDELEAGAKAGQYPARWDFEARVRRPFAEQSLSGQALERELESIAKGGAVYPSVVAYAGTARAESMIARGEIAGAISLLEDIVQAQAAPKRVLARSYAALGDAHYARAEAKSASGDAEGAKADYADARLAYMRVVVNFPFQYGSVAHSAIGAGRCFAKIKDEGYGDNAIRLFRFVRGKFRGTKFAEEAYEEEKRL